MRCLLVENYHQFPSALDFGSLPQFFARFRAQQTIISWEGGAARLVSRCVVRVSCFPFALLFFFALISARFFHHTSELMNDTAFLFLSKLTWLALGVDHAEPSRGGEQATALGRL